jgi:hypothetical protein
LGHHHQHVRLGGVTALKNRRGLSNNHGRKDHSLAAKSGNAILGYTQRH